VTFLSHFENQFECDGRAERQTGDAADEAARLGHGTCRVASDPGDRKRSVIVAADCRFCANHGSAP